MKKPCCRGVTAPINSLWHAKRKRVRQLLEDGMDESEIMALVPVSSRLIARVARERAA